VKDWHPSMRGWFTGALLEIMKENKRVVLITCDLGFGQFDKIRDEVGLQFYNVGAAEQAALGVGIGMAMKGKIPIVYSITNFVLYRPYEWIRNYLEHEQIPVNLVGSGRDNDYSHDGWTHQCPDAKAVIDTLPNVKQFFPKTKKEAAEQLKVMLGNGKPSFMSLRR